jgi:hypothetical protein
MKGLIEKHLLNQFLMVYFVLLLLLKEHGKIQMIA